MSDIHVADSACYLCNAALQGYFLRSIDGQVRTVCSPCEHQLTDAARATIQPGQPTQHIHIHVHLHGPQDGKNVAVLVEREVMKGLRAQGVTRPLTEAHRQSA